MLITELLPIRNRIREIRRGKAPRGLWRSRQRNRHSQTPRWGSSGSRLSSTKRRHSTCDGRSSAYSSRWVVCGSVTGCDPQAPSTLWIVIIRQRWRNSMLHSASCLELVLLVILRWYTIPSVLGNHHTNQTRRNDGHNRHRRGPAAPTASRPPRTLTQPEVGAQPTRSKRQARVGEALRMPGIPMRLDGDGTPEPGYWPAGPVAASPGARMRRAHSTDGCHEPAALVARARSRRASCWRRRSSGSSGRIRR